MYNSVLLRPCCFWLVGEKKICPRWRGEGVLLPKNCWDAARWKPSSNEQFGNTPELECRVRLWVCLPARESCRVEMAGTTLHVGNQLSPLLHAQLRTVPCWGAAFWVCTELSAASCDETGAILGLAFPVTWANWIHCLVWDAEPLVLDVPRSGCSCLGQCPCPATEQRQDQTTHSFIFASLNYLC